ncbi:MAG: hypothetical protein DRJ03_20210 [Chloroflexi bacterium]|nr:MAG: hypothetical protein B6I35_04260 [Anaerolineaceae bacterium 4572_32.2]RLC80682.1 MAG: hypothetical protein DRI81_03930 [Chloroflexota bacterium]RLC81407.1 MAG: hypothetical protein DRJ03_20210 [Chloroflexota bacterium]HEY72303.1 hypothetical protein [Thermoflexia bacterium]
MSVHLSETDLASLSDGGPDEGAAEHLRWCTRCRSAAADYRWLQGEIEGALAGAADALPVPRSKWRAVQAGVRAGRRRQVVGGRISVFASACAAVCLVLFVPGFSGLAVAVQANQPELAAVPAPITVPVEHALPVTTPTPAMSCEEATASPTPAFVLPPTAPKVEL